MLRLLTLFELIYQFRQMAFGAMCLVFLGLGWILGFNGYVGPNLIANSPYQIIYHLFMMSLGIVFSIMFHAVTGVLRDPQHRFESILYTTSLTKRDYFVSRYSGVLITGIIVLCMTLIGFSIGSTLSDQDNDAITSFNPWALLQTLGIVVIPNVFITSAIIFSVAVISKRSVWTYLSAILLYSLYWLCAIFLNSPMIANAGPASQTELIVAALADPFGISAFFELTQHWTTFQKNNTFVSLSGFLLINRVIWILASIVILFMTFRKCSFRLANQTDSKRKAVLSQKVASTTSNESYVPITTKTIGLRYHLGVFGSKLKMDLNYMIKNLPFLGGMGFWAIIVVTEIYTRINGGGFYGDYKYPTTDLLIWLISDPLPFMGLILIVYYSGMLMWRERKLQFASILEVTPTRNFVTMCSKVVALLSIPILLISVSIIIGVCFQVSLGYSNYEWSQWLSTFYIYGIPLAFYCVFSLMVQVLIKHSYTGMIIAGISLVLLGTSLAATIGIEHPMLIIGAFPEVVHSNMNGYGYTLERFHDYAMYWSSIALLIITLGLCLWPRGESNWGSPKFLTKPYPILVLLVLLPVVISTWHLYQKTNVEKDYISQETSFDNQEAYERKYKRYDDMDRLHRVSMKTTVDLYPSSGNYNIDASYQLKNKHNHPIKELFITDRVWVDDIKVERGTLVERDEHHGTWLFQFEKPILPGEEVSMNYQLRYERKSHDAPRMIAKNGTYLMHQYFEPSLAYRSSREINNPNERKKRGLPERTNETETEDHLSRHRAAIGKIPFETIISTASNQTAIAPGSHVKEWKENDRNYFHYKSPEDIVPSISYASANYAIQKEIHRNISIEQYYHPDHHQNIDAISQYAKATLSYCIDNFGNYPFNHLRIMEIPGHWNFGGQCMPGTISMVEDNLYLVDISDSTNFNLIAKRTIHEVAHQWWGGILAAKNVAGGSLLVEGLAKYTEAVVMEELFGKWPLVQLSESANNSYFTGRSLTTDPEPPIYLSEGENYLCYGKMYTVILAVTELIGAESMNEALAFFVDKHRNDKEFEATSIELLSLIKDVTPLELQPIFDDWFKSKMTYELAINGASYRALSDRRYEITAAVEARRFETLDNGASEETDINEPILMGVFKKRPEDCHDENDIISLIPTTINETNSTFKIIVGEEPTYLGINPYGARTEEKNSDNVKKLVLKRD